MLHCVDASEKALAVARRNLGNYVNCHFHQTAVDAIPLPPDSLDFCYSLGVLDHVPDTQAAIAACAAILKPGAPLLLYLLYSLDNRPPWVRAIWKMTDGLRRAISRLPFPAKRLVTGVIALCGYLALTR